MGGKRSVASQGLSDSATVPTKEHKKAARLSISPDSPLWRIISS
jgi:hypothetical protein